MAKIRPALRQIKRGARPPARPPRPRPAPPPPRRPPPRRPDFQLPTARPRPQPTAVARRPPRPVFHPATGGQFRPPPRQQPSRPAGPGEPRTYRPEAGWDFSVTQAYLPREIREAHPATPKPFGRAPLPSVPEQQRMAQAQRIAPHQPLPRTAPRAPEYEIGKPSKPSVATGPMVQVIDSAERLLHKYMEAEDKVAEAGQGKYVPWEDVHKFEDVTYNIGQWQPFGQEWVGKGLTGLAQSALVTAEALGEPARVFEKQIWGPAWMDDWVEKQQIQGDPAKERAMNAAMSVSYSGPEAVKRAYNDALQLELSGQLNTENQNLMEAKHGTWWKELGGRVVFDPMIWFDVLGGAGKSVRYGKQIKGAETMFYKPIMQLDNAGKATDKIVETAEIVKLMKGSSTRAGQARAAEDLLHKGLSFMWPRYKEAVVHRATERMSQVPALIAGITNKRAAANLAMDAERMGLKPGSVEFQKYVAENMPNLTRAATEEFQQAVSLWARTAADDVDAATDAARALEKLGYGDLPKSITGRETGVVLRRMMEKPNGEMGDLIDALDVGVREGLPVEDIAVKWYDKAAKVMDDLVPKQKWETGPIQRAVQHFPVLGTKTMPRRASDKAFGAMFMGLNPGYAVRNFYDNTGKALLMGYSPLNPTVNIEGKFGFGIMGAKRGIGQAGETTSLPIHKLAEATEKWQSTKIAGQAYMDILNRLEPALVKGLGGVDPRTQALVKNILHHDIGYIDRLAQAEHNLGAWQLLDNTAAMDAMNVADPHLQPHVLNILNRAETPEDAVAGLRQLQRQYSQHAVKMASETKPAGPLAGTLSGQAADLMGNYGQKFKGLDDLAMKLSGIEHSIQTSRAKAIDNLLDAVNPEQWQATMLHAEGMYKTALKDITRRQMNGYAKLLAGDIDEATYSKHLLDIYNTAYQRLDSEYGKIINSVLKKAEIEHTPEDLLRWSVHREALATDPQDYASAVIRGTFGPEDITHPFYIEGQIVPSAHFGNKVRALLREAGVAEERVKTIKRVEDLNQDELIAVVNGFRRQQLEARGLPFTPMSMDEILADAQRTMSPTAFGQAPKGLPPVPANTSMEQVQATMMAQRDALFAQIDELEAVVATDEQAAQLMRSLQRQADALDDQIDGLVEAQNQLNLEAMVAASGNDDAMRVVQAARNVDDLNLAVSPTMLDAASTTAERASTAIQSVIDDVMRKATDPPLAKAPLISPELAQVLRAEYIKAHTKAAEVARRSRDFVLLDYQDRRSIDGVLKFVFPWHYWYSRSMPNWAAGLAARPAVVSRYMEFRKLNTQANAQDPTIPEWAREQIAVRPPGYHGTYFWDFDAAFNAIGNIYDTFNDDDKNRDVLGDLIQKMSIAGPAVHPLLIMAYAAERGLLHGDKAAMRSYGYFSPQTKVFANLSGKTVEPWLWLSDPLTKERLPWTGGTKWDIEKGIRKMAYEQGQGKWGEGEAVLSAATHAGAPLMNTLTNDIAEYRRLPMLLSFVGGLRVSTRQDWENEVTQANENYWQLRDTNPEAAKKFLVENPWLSTMWLSWDNEAARTKILANNVFARIGPMPGKERQALLQAAGLNPELMEQFYAGKGEKESLVDWDKVDYDQFSRGVINLAKTLNIPDKATARKWAEAKAIRSDLENRLYQKYPQGQQQEATYYKIKETQGDDAARAYLEQPGVVIRDMWQDEMHEFLSKPTLLEFYGGPAKVDMFANSLKYERLKQEFGPDIFELRQQYGAIPDDDKIAKREFKVRYPQVMESYRAENDILKQVRSELTYLREFSGSGEIVTGGGEGANAMQRAILNTLDDFEFDRSIPVAPPPPPEEKFTPQEQAQMAAYDRANEHVYRADPEYFDKQREFEQIQRLSGDDAAFAYAQQSGLMADWDLLRIAKSHMPELLVNMEKEEIEKSAKALMREEAERMWPGLQDKIQNEYYAIPRNAWGDRRKWRDEHPEYRAFMDWKQSAIPQHYNTLMERRTQLRGQELAPKYNMLDVAHAIAGVESGGNYTAKNPNSTASGRYQYIDDTWNGYGGYATAAEAPPEVQDERMIADLQARSKLFDGDVEKVIAAHYYPKWADDKSQWNQTPPGPNTITVREYVDRILKNLRRKK